MTLFEAAKSVPALDVAERYASVKTVRKGRHAWTHCPFHNDGDPSLAFDLEGKYAGRFRCWSCGRQGSSVEFVAEWFNEKPADAAKRICADYGIAYDNADASVREKAKKKAADEYLTDEIREAMAFASCVASGFIQEAKDKLEQIEGEDLHATADRACLEAEISDAEKYREQITDAEAFKEALQTTNDEDLIYAVLTAKIGDLWVKDKLERQYKRLKAIDEQTGTNYVSWYKRGTL